MWLCKINNILLLVRDEIRFGRTSRAAVTCRYFSTGYHEMLHNQTQLCYSGTVRLLPPFTPFLCSHKITPSILKTDKLGFSESSDNVPRITWCHITQKTTLIVRKISKLHSREFCWLLLQFSVSLQWDGGDKNAMDLQLQEESQTPAKLSQRHILSVQYLWRPAFMAPCSA